MNPNSNPGSKVSEVSTNQTYMILKNLVKKMKIRKTFDGLVYTNNIIPGIVFHD